MADYFGDNPLRSALFTDLYELTMAQAYNAEAMAATAVFELFFRTLPATRQYVVAVGLDDVLTYLENFQVTGDDIAYLSEQDSFSQNFLQWLRELRFTGDVWAVPEGTLVFPNEPIVQVIAPIAEAQIVETLVLNQIHFQSVVATKAATSRSGCRVAHDCRLWLKAGALGRSSIESCPRQLPRRSGRHVARAGWQTLRHSHLRHDGSQLHPGSRQ